MTALFGPTFFPHPLNVDLHSYGYGGASVMLFLRCCPLAYIPNLCLYLYLTRKNDPQDKETKGRMLHDRVFLLEASKISTALSSVVFLVSFISGYRKPWTCGLQLVTTFVRIAIDFIERGSNPKQDLYNLSQQQP